MKIDDAALRILSTLVFLDERRVRIDGQLERKAYQKVDQVLSALGGTWSRRDRAHVFDGDARSKIDRAIVAGAVTAAADLGYFQTPVGLSAQLVAAADVRPGHRALEPSAGGGRLVDALLAAGAHVTALERDPDRRQQLSARAHERLVVVGKASGLEDFLDYFPDSADDEFDRVVMNPAFCRSGLGDHLDHVRHAFALLAPGGVLVSVFPAGITFRQDRRHAELRAWCEERGEISPLPERSFRESGTDVSTVMIRLAR